MAYADRNASGSRIVAIVLVAIIVAGMGYAFVTGLAYQYIKKKAEELKTFEVEEPPPPPEEVPPPPPPPDTPVPPPPTQVVSPPAIVQTVTPSPPMYTTPIIPPAPPISPPAPPAPVAPPAPPAPVINKAAGARGNPADWVTTDDYPASSLRNEEEGTTGIAWDINTQGRVENCRVTSSSGHPALDQAACRALTRKGRYSPALDQAGNPIRSSSSRRVKWQIPK
ncbi:energy transducer TonB [Sphingomonas sp. M1-B02]|uniref:energy transducer TonB n=1 Tax=Sphingomonas sp. M1-B02 TaxID=3114300 RepID=UPI00223EA33D|nr:energy transducer TonB [Sphingomonas sp. S6-11]UZK66728.1 energy transducer TonB [Sphingomonas sp. S6-11]